MSLEKLRSVQEEDEAYAVRWIRQSSDRDILHMWLAIQKTGGSTEQELISRFAQLGMTHAVLLADRDGVIP